MSEEIFIKNKGSVMIKTQIIKNNDVPVAVILDYSEYQRLIDLIEDRLDSEAFIKAEKETTSYRPLNEFLKELKTKENG
jgi:hypothetical protein